jgi:hypothetical protein
MFGTCSNDLTETWAAAVEPFLDDDSIVYAVHSAVRNGMPISDAVPALVKELVDDRRRLQKHALRLAETVVNPVLIPKGS